MLLLDNFSFLKNLIGQKMPPCSLIFRTFYDQTARTCFSLNSMRELSLNKKRGNSSSGTGSTILSDRNIQLLRD